MDLPGYGVEAPPLDLQERLIREAISIYPMIGVPVMILARSGLGLPSAISTITSLNSTVVALRKYHLPTPNPNIVLLLPTTSFPSSSFFTSISLLFPHKSSHIDSFLTYYINL